MPTPTPTLPLKGRASAMVLLRKRRKSPRSSPFKGEVRRGMGIVGVLLVSSLSIYG